MAFYKLLDEHVTQGNHIEGNGYVLISDYQETYELPIDDWYWFATDEEAYTFFNYTPPVPQEIGIPPIPPMV